MKRAGLIALLAAAVLFVALQAFGQVRDPREDTRYYVIPRVAVTPAMLTACPQGRDLARARRSCDGLQVLLSLQGRTSPAFTGWTALTHAQAKALMATPVWSCP